MGFTKTHRSTTGRGASLSRVVSSPKKTKKQLNSPSGGGNAATGAEYVGCSSSLTSLSESMSKREIASPARARGARVTSRSRVAPLPAQLVPVVGASGTSLMPCHPARARELVKKGKAIRRFIRGLFYIQMLDRKTGKVQKVACGIDPGSKREGFTVKSKKHTFLNLNVEAITHVKDSLEVRRNMRHARRFRKTPCRQPRFLRRGRGLPPSTKARWQWKLNICKILKKIYPINVFCVENIAAKTQKWQKRWNKSFSPLEVGKNWFVGELKNLGKVSTKQGYETKELRNKLGLKKSHNKLAEIFEAHCVDSWALAWSVVGGTPTPDNTRIYCISPIRLHRRQLHAFQPGRNGYRRPYGGTRSMGFKRGSLVRHQRYGVCYIGGVGNTGISLHSLETRERVCRTAKPEDCIFLCFNLWNLKGVCAISPAH